MDPSDDHRALRRRQIIDGWQKIFSGLLKLGLVLLLIYLALKYFAK
jgi:hypothetical protein